MATLTCVDGFEHKNPWLATMFPASTPANAVYSTVAGSAGLAYSDTTTRWDQGTSLRQNRTGAAASVSKSPFGATSGGVHVVSFYLYMSTKVNSSEIFSFRNSGTIYAYIYNNASGALVASCGGSSSTWIAAGSWTGGEWHLIDLMLTMPTSGTSRTLDGYIDGVSMTQVAGTGVAAETITRYMIGAADTATTDYYYDDFIASQTSGDFPLGDHIVRAKLPNDDSADSVYGTNIMEQGDGTDLSSSNKGYQYLNDFPPGTGTNIADNVTQAAGTSANFVEVEFENAESGEIPWAVEAYAVLQSDGTSGNNGTTRVVDSSNNTLVDVFSGDMSDSSHRWNRKLVPDPGSDGWTEAEFNGLAIRIGISTDPAPDPEWAALMLMYATDAPSSGTTFPQTVALTATLTPALINMVGKSISLSTTLTPAIQRAIGKTISLVSTIGLGIVKAIEKEHLDVAVTLTPALVTSKVKQVALAVATTLTAALSRMTGKNVAAGVTVTPSISRHISKNIGAAVNFTLGLTKAVSTTIAGGITLAANVVKKVYKALDLSTTLTAFLDAVKGTGPEVFYQSLDAVITFTGEVTKAVSKVITPVTVTLTAGLTKLVSKTIALGVTLTAAMTRAKTKLQSLAVTVTLTPVLRKQVGKAVSATVTLTGAMVRRVNKLMAGDLTMTANVTKRITKTLSTVTVTFTAVLQALQELPGVKRALAALTWLHQAAMGLRKKHRTLATVETTNEATGGTGLSHIARVTIEQAEADGGMSHE